MILDSGTTLTYWKDEVFDLIVEGFREQIEYPEAEGGMYGMSLCYDVGGDARFPGMVVGMRGGVELEVLGEYLFVGVEASGSVLCLAMAGGGELSIVGNVMQQNVMVVVDGVQGRVGFLGMECDKL